MGQGRKGGPQSQLSCLRSALQKSDSLVYFSGLRVKTQKRSLWNWDDTGSRLLGSRWRENLTCASRQPSQSLGHPAPSLGIFCFPSLLGYHVPSSHHLGAQSPGKTMHSDRYQRLSFPLRIPSTIVLEALYFGTIHFLIRKINPN